MDYNPIRKVARNILLQFGKAVTLIREQSGGVYNPVTGVTSAGSTVALTGVGALLSYNRRDIDNTNILATDRKLYFVGADIKKGDLYGAYRVHQVNRIDPDESGTILTIAQVRQ